MSDYGKTLLYVPNTFIYYEGKGKMELRYNKSFLERLANSGKISDEKLGRVIGRNLNFVWNINEINIPDMLIEDFQTSADSGSYNDILEIKAEDIFDYAVSVVFGEDSPELDLEEFEGEEWKRGVKPYGEAWY